MGKKILFWICMILFLVGCNQVAKNTVELPKPESRQGVTPWSVSFEETQFANTSLEGQVQVWVFWATWCPPCLEEIPVLNKLTQEFSEQDVSILGVSVDQNLEDYLEFTQSQELLYPTIPLLHSDGGVSLMTAAEQYGGPVEGIPTIIILDKSGNFVFRNTGSMGHAELSDIIQGLLDEK